MYDKQLEKDIATDDESKQDIKDQNHIIEGLVTENEYFKIITENMSDGLMIVAPDRSILYMNERAKELVYPDERYKKFGDSTSRTKYIDENGMDVTIKSSPSARVLRGEIFDHYILKAIRPDKTLYLSYSGRPVYKNNEVKYAVLCIRDITERMLAREALRGKEEQLLISESRFRTALNGSPVAVFSLDKNLRHNWVYNPSPGFSKEMVLGKMDDEIFCPEDAAYTMAIKKDVLTSGKSRCDEVTIHRPESERGDLILTMTTESLRDNNDHIIGVICAAIDVTESRRAEKALRASEKRLQSILTSMTDAYYFLDNDWKFVEVNQRGSFFLNRSREEMIGHNVWEIFPDAIGGKAWCEYHRAVAENIPAHFEMQSIVNGLFFEVHAYPEEKRLAVYLRDITERKRAEEALKESEEKYRTLFNSMGEGFSINDVIYDSAGNPIDFRYIEVNKAYEEHTGLRAEEIIGRTLLEIAPDIESSWIEAFANVAITGKPAKNIDYNQSTKRYYETLSFSPRKGRIAVILKNITELKQNEKQILDLVDNLQKADNNKNIFLSTLSHELRNPLATLSVGLQLLNLTTDEDKTKNTKEIISREMKQLCSLVDDLLDLTRINMNKIDLNKELIDLNKIVLAAVESFKSLYDEEGVCLEIEIGKDSIYIDADAVRITQIIGNLLHNALKFSTEEDGHVQTKVYIQNGEAIIRVKDNGIGIKPDFLPFLFEPFKQAEMTLDRGNGGLGLGLSIVKGIAEYHGGTVGAFSEGPDKGSTFYIRLPINRKETENRAEQRLDDDRTQTLRILLIEDNQSFADILCASLGLLGHSTAAAYNGLEGIQIAKEFLPDVILCDIGLPEMDGYEVARTIRKEPSLEDILMIAVTGYAGADDINRALEAGFNRHLSKPVDLENLTQILNAFFNT